MSLSSGLVPITQQRSAEVPTRRSLSFSGDFSSSGDDDYDFNDFETGDNSQEKRAATRKQTKPDFSDENEMEVKTEPGWNVNKQDSASTAKYTSAQQIPKALEPGLRDESQDSGSWGDIGDDVLDSLTYETSNVSSKRKLTNNGITISDPVHPPKAKHGSFSISDKQKSTHKLMTNNEYQYNSDEEDEAEGVKDSSPFSNPIQDSKDETNKLNNLETKPTLPTPKSSEPSTTAAQSVSTGDYVPSFLTTEKRRRRRTVTPSRMEDDPLMKELFQAKPKVADPLSSTKANKDQPSFLNSYSSSDEFEYTSASKASMKDSHNRNSREHETDSDEEGETKDVLVSMNKTSSEAMSNVASISTTKHTVVKDVITQPAKTHSPKASSSYQSSLLEREEESKGQTTLPQHKEKIVNISTTPQHDTSTMYKNNTGLPRDDIVASTSQKTRLTSNGEVQDLQTVIQHQLNRIDTLEKKMEANEQRYLHQIEALNVKHVQELEARDSAHKAQLESLQSQLSSTIEIKSLAEKLDQSTSAVSALQQEAEMKKRISEDSQAFHLAAREKLVSELQLTAQQSQTRAEEEFTRLQSLMLSLEVAQRDRKQTNEAERTRLREEHARLEAMQLTLRTEAEVMRNDLMADRSRFTEEKQAWDILYREQRYTIEQEKANLDSRQRAIEVESNALNQERRQAQLKMESDAEKMRQTTDALQAQRSALAQEREATSAGSALLERQREQILADMRQMELTKNKLDTENRRLESLSNSLKLEKASIENQLEQSIKERSDAQALVDEARRYNSDASNQQAALDSAKRELNELQKQIGHQRLEVAQARHRSLMERSASAARQQARVSQLPRTAAHSNWGDASIPWDGKEQIGQPFLFQKSSNMQRTSDIQHVLQKAGIASRKAKADLDSYYRGTVTQTSL